MEYLKTFESKYYSSAINDKFNQLIEKLEIDMINDEIDEMTQEIKDDVFSCKKISELLMLNYKKTRRTNKSINLEYYRDPSNSAKSDYDYLTNFIDRLNYKESLYIVNHFNIEIKKGDYVSNNIESDKQELKEFEDSIRSTIGRLENNGYITHLSHNYSNYDSFVKIINSINSGKYSSKESINSTFKILGDCITWRKDTLSLSINLVIIHKIDVETPTKIPTKLQTAFSDFIKTYQIPPDGQEKLKQLIKLSENS
jgi:uncharacterized protein (UPF0335 family)